MLVSLLTATAWALCPRAVGESRPPPQGVRGVTGLVSCLEGVQLLVGERSGVATLVIVTMPLDGVGE